MTGLAAATPWLAVGLLLLSVILVLHRPLLGLLRLTVRSSAALMFLTFLQELGGVFGITLGANLGNALVLDLLGVPGFGLLLMLQWLLRS